MVTIQGRRKSLFYIHQLDFFFYLVCGLDKMSCRLTEAQLVTSSWESVSLLSSWPQHSSLMSCSSLLSDVRAAREQINIGGLAYPPLPLHEGPPRPPSGYSQPASVCSSASFNGPFPGGVVSPQPHSSYYSGLSGPQHPFYNRVSRSQHHGFTVELPRAPGFLYLCTLALVWNYDLA